MIMLLYYYLSRLIKTLRIIMESFMKFVRSIFFPREKNTEDTQPLLGTAPFSKKRKMETLFQRSNLRPRLNRLVKTKKRKTVSDTNTPKHRYFLRSTISNSYETQSKKRKTVSEKPNRTYFLRPRHKYNLRRRQNKFISL